MIPEHIATNGIIWIPCYATKLLKTFTSAPAGPKTLKFDPPSNPAIIGPNIAAYSPIIGVAPEAIARAVDKGTDIKATVIPDTIFAFKYSFI